MGSACLNPARAGTIRRVVRHGSDFMCGLCRSHYRSSSRAEGCLETCWRRLLGFDPVIEKRTPFNRSFRCRFCARDHLTRKDGENCARDCRTKQAGRLEAERRLWDWDATGHKRPRVKLKPLSARPIMARTSRHLSMPRGTGEKLESHQPLGMETPIHADLGSPPPQESAAPEAEAAAEGKAKKKPDTVFYRDGAHYVCNICKEKYFTRIEVKKCFDAHE